MDEIEKYLESLRVALDMECDLHGGRSVMARDIRLAIIALEKELESLTSARDSLYD